MMTSIQPSLVFGATDFPYPKRLFPRTKDPAKIADAADAFLNASSQNSGFRFVRWTGPQGIAVLLRKVFLPNRLERTGKALKKLYESNQPTTYGMKTFEEELNYKAQELLRILGENKGIVTWPEIDSLTSYVTPLYDLVRSKKGDCARIRDPLTLIQSHTARNPYGIAAIAILQLLKEAKEQNYIIEQARDHSLLISRRRLPDGEGLT